jgi:hypothetical protein
LKKLAARDYEDYLQCCIPVIEGLLPEPHNTTILTLLYCLAEWHALAKLRLHTDSTLSYLERLTKELGSLMRAFQDNTCAAFTTVELPKEVASRVRRNAEKSGYVPPSDGSGGAKSRRFNLSTFKWHVLGDYVYSIRLFGPAPDYSTEVVCLLLPL